MPENFTLEGELERLAGEAEDANELWHNYNVMKSFVDDNYNGFIQANCPYYTDHGELHINSVIHSVDLLLKDTLAVRNGSVGIWSIW